MGDAAQEALTLQVEAPVQDAGIPGGHNVVGELGLVTDQLVAPETNTRQTSGAANLDFDQAIAKVGGFEAHTNQHGRDPGQCPYLKSMGESGIRWAKEVEAARNDPNREKTARELMAERRAQRQQDKTDRAPEVKPAPAEERDSAADPRPLQTAKHAESMSLQAAPMREEILEALATKAQTADFPEPVAPSLAERASAAQTYGSNPQPELEMRRMTEERTVEEEHAEPEDTDSQAAHHVMGEMREHVARYAIEADRDDTATVAKSPPDVVKAPAADRGGSKAGRDKVARIALIPALAGDMHLEPAQIFEFEAVEFEPRPALADAITIVETPPDEIGVRTDVFQDIPAAPAWEPAWESPAVNNREYEEAVESVVVQSAGEEAQPMPEQQAEYMAAFEELMEEWLADEPNGLYESVADPDPLSAEAVEAMFDQVLYDVAVEVGEISAAEEGSSEASGLGIIKDTASAKSEALGTLEEITRIAAKIQSGNELVDEKADVQCLEDACTRFFDHINITTGPNKEAVRRFVMDVLAAAEPPASTHSLQDQTQSFSTEELTKRGTHEYKASLAAVLRAHVIDSVSQRVERLIELGRYMLAHASQPIAAAPSGA